jgi:hypothetical protein
MMTNLVSGNTREEQGIMENNELRKWSQGGSYFNNALPLRPLKIHQIYFIIKKNSNFFLIFNLV